ncbi:MAG: HNH endonuclease [Candidatus Pacebacteria bacterium]|nr:HNH endonuclease [Candidatus Paceibacterota bacterium]
MKVTRLCKNCDITLSTHQYSYCSNDCQHEFQYKKYIAEWKEGNQSGNVGINTGNIANPLKRYLREKFKNKCSQCGWKKHHPKTGKVPLEIDHIDGDSKNNKENNLRLLCPNCHSLTDNYKNHNNGKGRTWRKAKYVRNKKYTTGPKT